MKFSELIEHCVACIKGFNPVIKTIDSHADEYIAQVRNHTTCGIWLTIFVFDSSRIHTRRSS